MTAIPKPDKKIHDFQLDEQGKKALTHLALEGIYPNEETLTDMELLDKGALTSEAFIARAIKRATL